VEEQTDHVFVRNFSLVVVALILFTFSIAFLARIVGEKEDEDIPSRTALTEERIKPVAGVYTGEDGAAAIQEAAVEEAPAQAAAAFDGSLDGEMIYGSVCAACHTAAVLGAPQPGSAEMAKRAEAGMDAMMQNALNGLNNTMPARGGRPDLSDEQIQAVIEFMLK
jgi:cytochrome c5